MTEAERYGDVQMEFPVFSVKHEEGPIQGVSPELSVSPAEVDFVQETSLPVLEDLVSQGSWTGEPEFEGCTIQRVLGMPEFTLVPCGMERSTMTRRAVESFFGLVIKGFERGQSKG